MGIGSFALGHTADAEKPSPKKILNKVEKQRENRDKALEHEKSVKTHPKSNKK
ncbi:MAG TPA: hypothetical protein VGR54_03265 [Nitrosopumilaceae archaeon]|nr:hypothetical protein [Nitrosopumilaceae archaeon]